MKNPFGTVRKCLQAHTDLFAIRDEDSHRIAEDLTEVKADFLVAAINSHEKLVEACELAWKIHCTNDIEQSPLMNKSQKMLEAAFVAAKGEK